MTEEQLFLPFEDGELAAGARYLRTHRRYADLMPPPGEIKWNWFLARAIGIEIAERRTPDVVLPMLVGDIVRKYVPDTSPETRRLGMALRDAAMYMFRRRKDFKRSRRRKTSGTQRTENESGQKRLL